MGHTALTSSARSVTSTGEPALDQWPQGLCLPLWASARSDNGAYSAAKKLRQGQGRAWPADSGPQAVCLRPWRPGCQVGSGPLSHRVGKGQAKGPVLPEPPLDPAQPLATPSSPERKKGNGRA